jgi:3-deoxy-D-arabino-heptulosonate 7-phosphate (DAHP) synthase
LQSQANANKRKSCPNPIGLNASRVLDNIEEQQNNNDFTVSKNFSISQTNVLTFAKQNETQETSKFGEGNNKKPPTSTFSASSFEKSARKTFKTDKDMKSSSVLPMIVSKQVTGVNTNNVQKVTDTSQRSVRNMTNN